MAAAAAVEAVAGEEIGDGKRRRAEDCTADAEARPRRRRAARRAAGGSMVAGEGAAVSA